MQTELATKEDQKSSAAPKSGGASAQGGQAGRASLRGMSFSEGEDALAPSEGAPVQRQVGGGAPNVAPTQAPPGGGNSAQVAPGAPEAAPVKEILTPRQVLDAWDVNRVAGLSIEWISALQGALAVPVTGTSSKELVRAVAKLQSDNNQKKSLGMLTGATRTFLIAQFPALATIPQKAVAEGLHNAQVSGNATAPESEALRALQIAPSYPAYAAGLKTMSFLGHPVVGHVEFLGRLANAQKHLSNKMPGKSDTEIGTTLGITKTSHFRTSSASVDNMYHGLGFALDVNPPQNNWHFGSGGRAAQMSSVMKHVGDLFGEKMIRNASDMSKNAKEGTTEELFAKLEASNDALKQYRRLATDKPALEAHLASDKAPPRAKSKGADGWMTMMANDEKWLAKQMHAGAAEEGPAGFMDYKKELVVALRDAGGLRWGGADLGGDNGDLMHFDGGTMDLAKRIRNKVRAVRTAAAAQAQPAPGAAPAPG